MGLFGPPDIDKLKTKGDVKGLVKALGYQKDMAVRWRAAAALGDIGDASAMEPLAAALEDPDKDVRAAADEALGKIGAREHIGPLITSLRAPGGTLPDDQLACVACSKVLQDWHYGFESIILSRGLGWQCSSCGQAFCWEHAPATFRNRGDKCSCGGWVMTLDEGPALSSMVEAAARDGKYGRHFRPPGSSNRRVRQG
jgi:hypothetical protein